MSTEPVHSSAEGVESTSGHRLAVLAQIVRAVDSAPDLDSALAVLVRRTREVIGADVCTVYFTDEDNHRHVIAATDGLSSSVIGKVECGFGKGLAGRVAESRRALNFEQVPPELDQDFLLQTGDAPYRSFLGVPVVHKTRVQGVLLVRQHEVRRFDHTDEAFLTTLAAQLGGALAYAKASGEWCTMCRPQDSMPARIEGLAGAPGLAIGHGVVVPVAGQIDQIPDRAVVDVAAEESRLCAAVQSVREDITELGRELEGTLSEADRALFDAYTLMLDSPEILDAARDRVRQGVWAPSAISRAIDACTSRFDTMQDPYLRERAADIRALGDRILSKLLGNTGAVTIGQHATVLIGQSLSAIDIGQALKGNLVGIISGDGSPLSHAAILARALGIPAVVGIFGLPLARLDGQELVVDGTAGQVHLRLSASMRQAFEQTIDNQRRQSQTLESVRGLDAVTADGDSVALYINAGLSLDLEPAVSVGSAGIGLFRSELPFMMFDRLPSEQEQQQIYRQTLEAVHPLPVTLRTLDVGGDKNLPYMTTADANPPGSRGIRFMLDHPEIFLTQLRAALKADIGLGNLRLLLPMISGVDELEQAQLMLEQAILQLQNEGLPITRPPVGAMIEVPAAVYQAEALARRVDFLSVGTNDLAQYLLATDRNNPHDSAHLYPAHPALLQALKQVRDSAWRTGTPVTICGEIAGEPAIALLLLGMGFDGLSMNPAALPGVKWAVRRVTSARMRALALESLQCERPEEVHRLLETLNVKTSVERPAPESQHHHKWMHRGQTVATAD